MPTSPITSPRQPCLCTTVRRADRTLNRVYDEALAPSGLLTTQYALLSTLARAGEPLLHSALAEAQLMAPATLSRNLKPLQRDGLLVVRPGEDRRTRYVALTPAGEAALAAARPLWRAVQARMQEVAGEDRFAALIAELQEIVALLRATDVATAATGSGVGASAGAEPGAEAEAGAGAGNGRAAGTEAAAGTGGNGDGDDDAA